MIIFNRMRIKIILIKKYCKKKSKNKNSFRINNLYKIIRITILINKNKIIKEIKLTNLKEKILIKNSKQIYMMIYLMMIIMDLIIKIKKCQIKIKKKVIII